MPESFSDLSIREIREMYDRPVVRISEDEERRLSNGEVVVKERGGMRFAFHNGSGRYSTEIRMEYNADTSPWSEDWMDTDYVINDGWSTVVAILERNRHGYNLP